MSSIWLIRHGQAGLRQNYDELSETGRRQARCLGACLAHADMPFHAVYSGTLRRQRETAELAVTAGREAGVALPEPVLDAAWNEFDLDGVYRDIAPALAAIDRDFRREYEELERLMADKSHAIHHSWSRCDVDVVRAWIEGRCATQCESWTEFQQRIRGRFGPVMAAARQGPVAVFTSATPIAVWMGAVLGAADRSMLRFAGVMYNSAITSFRLHGEELMLFSFNGIPHLRQPELKTFR